MFRFLSNSKQHPRIIDKLLPIFEFAYSHIYSYFVKQMFYYIFVLSVHKMIYTVFLFLFLE